MPQESRADLQLRQVRFGAVIDRLLRAAAARGMTVEDIEKATGVGNTTFYAWRNGKWNRDPVPAKVRDFVEGLGGSFDEACAALGWATPIAGTRRPPPEPITEDPLVVALKRKLVDPKLSAREKNRIRRTIEALLEE